MEIPTLKPPPPHDKMEARRRYELGLLDPDGFAATYFDTLKRAEEKVKTGYSYATYKYEDYPDAAEREAKTEALCKKVNEEYETIRKKIDQKMQEYLLYHDGQVDFWPDGSGFHILSADGKKFHFHYFGDEYFFDYTEIFRFSKGLSYHNGYVSPRTPGTTEYGTIKKKEHMEEKVKRAKEMTEHTRKSCIAGMIGAIPLLFVMVSILLNLLFSMGGPVASLLMSASNFLLDQGIDQGAGIELYPILRIVCLVLTILGLWGCFTQYLYYRDFKRDWKENERAYEEYVSNSYEQELKEEMEREAKKTEMWEKDIELATRWHSAWFEWAKRVGDTPEDL